MADYQVRNWLAWHHHLALVLMALLFMTRHRKQRNSAVPLFSCHDIRMFPAHFLLRGNATTADVLPKWKAATGNGARRRQPCET